MEKTEATIKEVSEEFSKVFGRQSGGLIKTYNLDKADIVIVAMGSIVGTIKDTIDRMKEKGKSVGLLQICSFRPFPRKLVYQILKDKTNIVVVEKAISLGRGGILGSDVRWSFPRTEQIDRRISNFVAGLGGRDITMDDMEAMVERVEKEYVEFDFLGLNRDLISERDL